MKRIEFKRQNGDIYYSKTIELKEESLLKKRLRAQAIYNLLFLSKEYSSRNDAFDFIEFSSIDKYGKIFFVESDTYRFIAEIDLFNDSNISKFIDINREFSELVRPNWDKEILDENGPWKLLRIKTQNFLNYLNIPYKDVDLDDFVEENEIA